VIFAPDEIHWDTGYGWGEEGVVVMVMRLSGILRFCIGGMGIGNSTGSRVGADSRVGRLCWSVLSGEMLDSIEGHHVFAVGSSSLVCRCANDDFD
jgi:hypothetical protein